MAEETIPAGHWWTLGGDTPDEPLVIQPVRWRTNGPDPERVDVTGWRHLDNEPGPEYVTVQVSRERWPR